jgi:hypothetical protein
MNCILLAPILVTVMNWTVCNFRYSSLFQALHESSLFNQYMVELWFCDAGK